MNPPTTILIPHFQTLDSIRLCLRSIRKYTPEPYAVRVLDNGSKDASIDYLRSLNWIQLVETGHANDIWKAHYLSLNDAVVSVCTPYFLVMHSDTYVHHAQWLDHLYSGIQEGYSAIGSRHQRVPVRTLPWVAKSSLTRFHTRTWKRGVPILRSFCALYETQPFLKLQCRFCTRHGEDISYAANEVLVENGYKIKGLSAYELSRYLFHASAITLIAQGVSPVERSEVKDACQRGLSYLDKHTYRKSRSYLDRFLSRPSTKQVLADASLDS